MPIVRRAASCTEGILNAKNWNEFGGRLGIYSVSYTHANFDTPGCSHSRRCATWFHISSEARITEVVDGEGGVAQPGATGPLGQMDSTKNYNLMYEEGRKLFRRWHVIMGVDHKTTIMLVESWPSSLFIVSSILR